MIIKSCKHSNHEVLRGKEEIKQTQRHLGKRTIKMQNGLLVSVLQQSVIRSVLTTLCCWYKSQEKF